jgi:hypothetical protein
MNYRVISFSSLTFKEKQKFYNFCKEQSTEISQPAAMNMWHDDWKSHSYTLPHILEIGLRFQEPFGDFNILMLDSKFVACAGIYQSAFCKDISIAGCRTWVSKEFRNKNLIRDCLLPAQKKWSIDNDYKIVCLSFNEYNKNIVNTFKRTRLGEGRRVIERKPHHLFYTGLHEVEFLVNIQYTPQWVIYEKIDPNYQFNWDVIKAV